ncbi:MAG: protein-methionine-sulfoxide reductase heme-binding subunit MsrQ [Gammaproteobacteria bacterium]|nr:MAG: protein-methionine-sulfoxide reductase heme-binding subunit MsrQ [Gammaproteobacteria bacterium]
MTLNKILLGKAVLFVVGLAPLISLVLGVVQDELGANPIEYLARATGDWTLRFLMLTLAVTPIREITGWRVLLRYRRMLGLYVFFYACLHFSIYVFLDLGLKFSDVFADIVKRPYITVGFTAFLLLVPLAATSNRAMIRRLGAGRWQRLHRLVYAIAMLGVLHFWWQVKSDLAQPVIYSLILIILLGYRVMVRKVATVTA